MDKNSEHLADQLYDACSSSGHHSQVIVLLHNGADPNHNYYNVIYGGLTPLHLASMKHKPLTAHHLVQWGAYIDATTNIRDTLIYHAAGETPLHYACHYNSRKCVAVLLRHHCRTDIKNEDGETAADIARKKGFPGLAYFIKKYKCAPREPLSSYPSMKRLQQLKLNHCHELGLILGIQDRQLHFIMNDENPTPAVLVAAKVNNEGLKWKDLVAGLQTVGDYATAAMLIHQEVFYGWVDLLKYLVEKDGQESLNDCILFAATKNHKSIVEYLLNEYHIDPNVMDKQGRTPLALTNDPAIMKILLQHGAKADNIYRAYRDLIGKLSSERPPEIPLPVFITGDGGVGKSTLLKSILTSKGLLAKFSKSKPVTGVDEKTVGIIPYEVSTVKFGRVTIYDFAGQQEFYGSHSAVLENAVQGSPPIVIYCADLQESERKIADSNAWWMTLVQKQCKDLQGKAHVIVVGSHADMLRESGENPRDKESIFGPIIQKFPKFEFIAFIPMDCRFADSPEIKQVRKFIQNSSALLRSPEAVDFNAHAFQIYLIASFKEYLAVSMKVVQRKIRHDLDETESEKTQNLVSFIPSTLRRLVEICSQLNNKGLILFLHNEASPEESFIVCDRAALLSNITGTVFAPEGFRQHCSLASSTGVVPLYKFSEQFEGYDIEMLIAFMSHLELCFEIKDMEVLDCVSKVEQNPDPDGRYLFFPGLIRIPTPERVWEEVSVMCYHFGWILQTSQDIEFFDPRCFQVLIQRIVFTFGLAPAARVQHDIPSLQRFCSVWKSGISWSNDDGVTANLELSDNGKSLAVKVRSKKLKPECLALRSKIISKVLETVKDYCPNVETTESIIDPEQVVKHPLKPASSLTLFTIPDTAVAVVSNKDEVKSMYGSQSLRNLVQFEPYVGLDYDALQCIHSQMNSKKNEKISDGFISHFADQVANPDRAHMYRGILNPPQASSAQASQTSSPRQEVAHSLERWRKETEGTYTCLRETLNKYSIFTGRNPLDIAGVAHCAADPSLLFPEPPSTDTQQDESGTELLPLDVLREILMEVRSDWYNLAVELDIEYGTRKAIDKDNFTVEAKFDAMSQYWVRRTSPPPTWAALARAIRSPAIGRRDIADCLDGASDDDSGDAAVCQDSLPQTTSVKLDVNKHLKLVRAATWEVRAQWYSLGEQLDIPEGTRKVIQRNHQTDCDGCFTALLEEWLIQTSPPPTLGGLLQALKSAVIDRQDIARNIEVLLLRI